MPATMARAARPKKNLAPVVIIERFSFGDEDREPDRRVHGDGDVPVDECGCETFAIAARVLAAERAEGHEGHEHDAAAGHREMKSGDGVHERAHTGWIAHGEA